MLNKKDKMFAHEHAHESKEIGEIMFVCVVCVVYGILLLCYCVKCNLCERNIESNSVSRVCLTVQLFSCCVVSCQPWVNHQLIHGWSFAWVFVQQTANKALSFL